MWWVGGENSSRASYLFRVWNKQIPNTCVSFALLVVVLRKLLPLVNPMSTKGNMTFLLANGYGAHLLTVEFLTHEYSTIQNLLTQSLAYFLINDS